MSNDPRCTICYSLLHFTADHPQELAVERARRRIAAGAPLPRPDGPGAPAPNPAPAAAEQRALLPTTRTAAPVEEQIADILAITGQQVARYKGRTDALGLRELQALEALARTIKLTHELDKEVRAGLEEEFGKQDSGKLEGRLAELTAQARR